MRSETEIRKQVEARLRRRGLFVLNGGLWFITGMFLWFGRGVYYFISDYSNTLLNLMLLWTFVLGLHFFFTVYVELREYLVRRAIEQERRYYVMSSSARPDDAEKPKRAADVARLELTDDGELIDFDDLENEDSYVQRNRNR